MRPDDDQPRQSIQSAWVLRLRGEALALRDADMSRILYVGLLLATYADADGQGARPAPATLAAISGFSEDMVRRCLAALVGAGMLLRRRRQGAASVYRLLVPAGPLGSVDWRPHLAPFGEARAAAARRRARSAERTTAPERPSRRGIQNARRDGEPEARMPVASGNSEHPSRRGIQDPEYPSRRAENTRRDGYENARRVGGGPIPTSTSGRDPDHNQTVAEPVPQPQVRAREAEPPTAAPGLHALPGGGRAPGGQPPLLLPVTEPAPLDRALVAAHMTALYSAPVPLWRATRAAVEILGDLDVPDPTAHVISALDADPGRYRPPLPPPGRTATRRRPTGT